MVFKLTIPRTFVNDRLALNVELSQRQFSSQSEWLDIPVVVRRPVLVSSFTVAGRLGGRAIDQNETADLEVRVVNTGNLAAEEVRAGIDVKVPGVEVQGPKSVAIGTVRPNGQSLARFKLQVRRSVPPGGLPIFLHITQSDFVSVTDTLKVEVKPEKEIVVSGGGSQPPPPIKPQDTQPRDCNRAFGEYFEKAQTTKDVDKAIAFYREGLALCPNDDVAHYELGNLLASRKRYAEAEQEFATALKINVDFGEAKKQLEAVRKTRR
ncbi:MAG: tetratricopeptide repeat protein [Deltaproteobacteria bacterium]|nr:tetratricopeptide repeat protein [Deltaproteobacteria bacterium]